MNKWMFECCPTDKCEKCRIKKDAVKKREIDIIEQVHLHK